MANTCDAHLHFFTKNVFTFYGRQVPDWRLDPDPAPAAAARIGVQLPPDSTRELADQWIQELDRHGVSLAVLFGSAPGEQKAIAEAVRAYPGRFVGFQMLNPRAPDATDQLEAIASLGLRGVLLFPAMHAFFPDDPVCEPVYQAARTHRLCVFVHIGRLRMVIREKLGLPDNSDFRFGDSGRLAVAMRKFPEVSFIVPHFACGLLEPLLASAQGIRNLYLDTSSSNAWMAGTPALNSLRVVFERALNAKTLGPDRLIFGTDSTTFPRGWRKDIYTAQREALDQLGLTSDEKQMILGENLERLLD